ncbi:hypothetical protein LP416_25640 [Polaromonas sp. P2-4]|nr:hypothetical protein LP416_25640 [Polaromonas sp. P2-4]
MTLLHEMARRDAKKALPACVLAAVWGLPSHWNAEYQVKLGLALVEQALQATNLIASDFKKFRNQGERHDHKSSIRHRRYGRHWNCHLPAAGQGWF